MKKLITLILLFVCLGIHAQKLYDRETKANAKTAPTSYLTQQWHNPRSTILGYEFYPDGTGYQFGTVITTEEGYKFFVTTNQYFEWKRDGNDLTLSYNHNKDIVDIKPKSKIPADRKKRIFDYINNDLAREYEALSKIETQSVTIEKLTKMSMVILYDDGTVVDFISDRRDVDLTIF